MRRFLVVFREFQRVSESFSEICRVSRGFQRVSGSFRSFSEYHRVSESFQRFSESLKRVSESLSVSEDFQKCSESSKEFQRVSVRFGGYPGVFRDFQAVSGSFSILRVSEDFHRFS